MSQLAIPKIECTESRDNFGKFVAEPLEKGFGVTLGNALRRILLSSLPGAAVARVKIDGIQHEFSPIPYVKEDVIEFLLNVKALRLKPLSGQPGKLILDVSGERQVYAGDIQSTTDFEITNPELYLATLNSPEAKLYVEFDVELGKGYKQAESSSNLPIGVIPVDAIFTPTRKVNFTIEATHIGQETSQERLCLEVWTDGTISPSDAISLSAELLTNQLSPFASYVSSSEKEMKSKALRPGIPDEQFNTPVDQLDLSVRTMNCLRRGGITTVGELVSRGEEGLLSLRNFGHKSMKEVEERLNAMGLSLYSAASDQAGKPSPRPQAGENIDESTAQEGNDETEKEETPEK